ncbi:hypothetical protein DM558_01900 [Entomomonas moraniae]|uniref:Uncharacterized protein n=1 Tax=Entomomonas moraniae TaxID=2213226 RepID=A0A3S9XAX6_9GAMM|nr:hypothetical protein [Entomomonas moraniae]AZS49604.1 hypothetical protein DM558_01900 [Entomomonas moraniae]
MFKFFIPFGLTICSSIVNSAPCYTDIEDGCNDGSIPILVKTENTDQGFCTEYTNEEKQKIVRCFKKLPESEKQEDTQIKVAEQRQPINQQLIYTNQSQQINNYYNNYNENYNSRDSGSGYWAGYWNGYNNNYHGNHYPNRPPPPHNRPPREPPVMTYPSRYVGKRVSSKIWTSSGPSRPQNRPNRPRPNKPNYSDSPISPPSRSVPSRR